jgi:hypothetical protein
VDKLERILKQWETKPQLLTGVRFNWEKSGWVKKSGIWLKNLTFLGTTYNHATESLEVPDDSGGILTMPLKDLAVRNLWKFVGKTYNVSSPEPWTWKIHDKSYLRYIERFFRGERRKWDKETIELNFMSTICSGILLEQSKKRRFDKKFLGELALPNSTLAAWIPENLFSKDLRGRLPGSKDTTKRKPRSDKDLKRGPSRPPRTVRKASS